MIFVETIIFTRQIDRLLSHDEYLALQQRLAETPEVGPVIPGTGGLRKTRWRGIGKGTRGGIRVIYYHFAAANQIRLLLAYAKASQENLTEDQKKIIRQLNEEWR
ncbi:mRNA-degrading endonuclease RelE of RelBE toxin-antitoxin system [Natronocella acetinitrilica]|uniref:mRNA-degrading endonuclease RelE of RelBE toxin-antitoxin system n=1 Tax=Natronocella acetinitrilica TaxID=414046 RepID=A0AAE3KCU6_9GAMM|nr:type II toxin-antitoxin system RelE/ParE family toxin [Natronocella acetinitrilica]MCP1675468.1 mRNA-degrading endonuclease RelE of RelBE toxin-antitoxin system [Natronocella acetinitrilica]